MNYVITNSGLLAIADCIMIPKSTVSKANNGNQYFNKPKNNYKK